MIIGQLRRAAHDCFLREVIQLIQVDQGIDEKKQQEKKKKRKKKSAWDVHEAPATSVNNE